MNITPDALSNYSRFVSYAAARVGPTYAEDIVQTALVQILRSNNDFVVGNPGEEVANVLQNIRWMAGNFNALPGTPHTRQWEDISLADYASDGDASEELDDDGFIGFASTSYDALEGFNTSRPVERLAELHLYLAALDPLHRHLAIAAVFGLSTRAACGMLPMGFCDLDANLLDLHISYSQARTILERENYSGEDYEIDTLHPKVRDYILLAAARGDGALLKTDFVPGWKPGCKAATGAFAFCALLVKLGYFVPAPPQGWTLTAKGWRVVTVLRDRGIDQGRQ